MMKNILNHFSELFFPRLCICCQNRLIAEELHMCFSCLNKIPRTNHLSVNNNKLEDFFAGRFPFQRIASFALFVKEGSIQKIIHEFKYKNNPDLAKYMGELCGKEISFTKFFVGVDVIVPIPLHNNKLKKRGYNQSLLIAEGISQIINKPVNSENLIRKTDNPAQAKSSRLERWENTEGIFEIVDKDIFEGKHVLLIDDVITTGSTIEVCSKLILQCQDTKISVYAVGSAF